MPNQDRRCDAVQARDQIEVDPAEVVADRDQCHASAKTKRTTLMQMGHGPACRPARSRTRSGDQANSAPGTTSHNGKPPATSTRKAPTIEARRSSAVDLHPCK